MVCIGQGHRQSGSYDSTSSGLLELGDFLLCVFGGAQSRKFGGTGMKRYRFPAGKWKLFVVTDQQLIYLRELFNKKGIPFTCVRKAEYREPRLESPSGCLWHGFECIKGVVSNLDPKRLGT